MVFIRINTPKKNMPHPACGAPPEEGIMPYVPLPGWAGGGLDELMEQDI
jgi:hypothetical protein